MFDWLKRKKQSRPVAPSDGNAQATGSSTATSPPTSSFTNDPETCAANPAKYVKGKFTFTRGKKSWEEAVNAIDCLSDALRRGPGGQSFSFQAHKSWIELDGGFIIMPRFLSFQPLDQGGVQTVTTIEVSNPAGIPPGVFEFQHSTGDNVQDSFVKGFESWMQTDLPVFMDALLDQPKRCTYLNIESPSEGAGGSKQRRVVLGPVAHLVPKPLRPLKPEAQPNEEHPFCPCCLFTRTGDIWKQKIADGGFYGVRLFALRGPDGEAEADCRVNGLDWPEGKRALVDYANTWPDLGLEFRKQYIVLQAWIPNQHCPPWRI